MKRPSGDYYKDVSYQERVKRYLRGDDLPVELRKRCPYERTRAITQKEQRRDQTGDFVGDAQVLAYFLKGADRC
jgi:hypothetical protein